MSRKSKVKWTQQVNTDVLECKRKAQELVTSGNAPFNLNGRRKGYIEAIKELWEEKCTEFLELKAKICETKLHG